MNVSVFLDSNILIYAVSRGDRRQAIAQQLLAGGGILSVQVLNEFVNTTRKKLRLEWQDVLKALDAVRLLCEPPIPITVALHEEALNIAQRYKFRFYDALIVAAALSAGCTTLYTEDLQQGQTIGTLAIVNPF